MFYNIGSAILRFPESKSCLLSFINHSKFQMKEKTNNRSKMKHNMSVVAEYSLLKSSDYQHRFLSDFICFTYSGY